MDELSYNSEISDLSRERSKPRGDKPGDECSTQSSKVIIIIPQHFFDQVSFRLQEDFRKIIGITSSSLVDQEKYTWSCPQDTSDRSIKMFKKLKLVCWCAGFQKLMCSGTRGCAGVLCCFLIYEKCWCTKLVCLCTKLHLQKVSVLVYKVAFSNN